MGSPDFAVAALQALYDAGHTVAAVYCQPPRPAGRGHAVRPCPVQLRAESLELMVRTPARLRSNASEHAAFAALDIDAAIVAAYGLIIPAAMLQTPRRGCLNIHASLLPRWRGAAPIQAAILAGDAVSGVTIMQMDAGLDTGPILLRQEVAIGPRMTARELHDRLAAIGPALALRALAEAPRPIPQPESGVTYAAKLTRESGRIDWTRDADVIDKQVRALNPWPGTFTTFNATTLKILEAEPARAGGIPATVLDGSLTVACSRGALRLLRVQAPGGAAMPATDFLRGHPVPAGSRLG